MTGQKVKSIREQLGMTPSQFANLIGVHQATLYRWEAKGEDPVRLDPMQLKILTVLQEEIRKRKDAEDRAEWAQGLTTALLIGGGLFALFKVLETVFDDREGS